MKVQSIKNQKPGISNPAGFTLVEIGAAMTILAMAMILVLQISFWSLRERARTAAHHVAIEQAANLLEAARSVPWESLTPEWAAGQRIPDELDAVLIDGTLSVTVDPVESVPLLKRVTVEVRWMLAEGVVSRPVRLVDFISARSTAKGGDQ